FAAAAQGSFEHLPRIGRETRAIDLKGVAGKGNAVAAFWFVGLYRFDGVEIGHKVAAWRKSIGDAFPLLPFTIARAHPTFAIRNFDADSAGVIQHTAAT